MRSIINLIFLLSITTFSVTAKDLLRFRQLDDFNQKTSSSGYSNQTELGSNSHNTAISYHGTLKQDSIVLLSPDTYCKGSNPRLSVTGENVKWYADSSKKTLLSNGNIFAAPSLNQTTSYFVTQTINNVESLLVEIKINIVELILLNVTPTPAGCGKNDGKISITSTGGSKTLYRLNKGPYQSSPNFNNLSPGTYLVTDSVANCYGSISVTVTQAEAPKINNIAPVSPQCGNADGAITVSAYGGNGTLSYSLNGIDFKADNQFSNLTGGDYIVFVRDQNLCEIKQPVSLKKTIKLRLKEVEVHSTTCGLSNGNISISSYQGNGNILYSVDGLNYQASGLFEGLSAGVYNIFIKDETNCSDAKTVSVGNSEGPKISTIQTVPSTCETANGTITISATGINGLSYSLDGMPYQTSPSFQQLPNGEYAVTVKDGLNCIIKETTKLGSPCETVVYLPDIFTPNQDGINDGWGIFFPFSTLQLEDLTIFNRWGEIIFHKESQMINSGEILWDGTYKNEMQIGIYTYQLLIQLPTGKSHTYRGRVELTL